MTYVRKGGRLVPLPDGLMMMVPTKILPLLTTAPAELGHQDPHGAGTAPRAQARRPDDESVAEFVEEHYGAGGGGLPGRAAALRHLRRRSRASSA